MTSATETTQKTALITGCSSGIGRALALEFAKRGFRVVATARSADALEDLAKLHSNIIPASLGVQNSDSIAKLKARVTTLTGGRLDYLVNNAGAHYASTALDLDASKVRDLFEVNVISVMVMCQTFAEALIAAKGVIVQIGSVTRDVPVVWQGPYNASKAALSQYSKTARLELEPFGVRVVEVVTGYVQSNILRNGLHAPANSRYLTIKDDIETMKDQGNKGGVTSSVYAYRVVDRVTQSWPSREIWEGAQAWSLWFIVSWLPLWLQHRLWNRAFQLHKLGA